jgi:uncharacterized protein (TIGR03083 family)
MALRDPAGLPERGMTDAGRDVVLPLAVAAWDAFIEVAARTDLDRKTRLPGWRAHDVCTHLGRWPDFDALAGLIEGARAGASGQPPDVDTINARVVAAHGSDSREEVLDALRRHRDTVAAYAQEPLDLDGRPTDSPVGLLPLLSVILGEAYELAVHALDLGSAGGPEAPADLLQAGLAALADVTGALAAASSITGGAALHTPEGGWAFEAGPEGWRVVRLGPQKPDGVAIRARADRLLDASAGRGNPVTMLARRRLSVQDLPGLLALAPIAETAPNIPGGPILALAARTMSGATGFLRR